MTDSRNFGKFSIIMPVFNEEEYIRLSVKSVLMQTYHNFELIIVDDGSTDKTIDIVKNTFNDDRIVVLSPGKVGKVRAFNLGYSKASGDWILFFGGDDIMTEDSLESRIRPLRKFDPRATKAVSYGALKTISNDRKFDGLRVPKSNKVGNKSGGTILLSRALTDCLFPIPADLPNEDTWTMIGSECFADIEKHIPEVVLFYRIHSNNSHSRYADFSKANEMLHSRHLAFEKFYEKHKDYLRAEVKQKLFAIAKGERMRYQGKYLQILFVPKLPLKKKLSYAFHCNKFFYSLRMKYFKFFSGW